MSTPACPALLVSAPASGQGKTLVTAALARAHRRAGRRVRVFKCGPDFLDPMVLAVASGAPVFQLDLWMCGEEECRARLNTAAQQADLILVEGVMGLFDGDPCAADLAARLGLPVLAVIDGSAMAGSFGALAHGLATYRQDITLAAVLANRVGGERHAEMLRESLRGPVRWLGALPRAAELTLPERHLGLVQAGEIADLDARLDRAAAQLGEAARWLPPTVAFPGSDAVPPPRLLDGRRIAIARDAAFAFLYPANLDLLERMGVQLCFFSPLAGDRLPDCDAVWLPGGYPELHLERLSAHHGLIADLHRHHAAGKPILAECGGMLFCLDELNDGRGACRSMAGLMPGRATMQSRLAALGLQEMPLGASGRLRGHTFHFSQLETPLEAAASATNPNGGHGEDLFRFGALTASFAHLYFPSAPEACASLFR